MRELRLLAAVSLLAMFALQTRLWVRHVEDNRPTTAASVAATAQVTVVIKTLERHDCLLLTLQSVRLHHPQIPIVVLDDTPEPLEDDQRAAVTRILSDEFPHVEYRRSLVSLGAGAGRNQLVDSVSTPYLVMLDDDHLLSENTRINHWIAQMEAHSLDLAAAVFLDRFIGEVSAAHMYRDGNMLHLFHVDDAASDDPAVCLRSNFVLQVFAARTELFERAKWDPKLRTAEHEDFMLSLEAVGARLGTCHCAHVTHNRNWCKMRPRYLKQRQNYGPNVKYWMHKWSVLEERLLGNRMTTRMMAKDGRLEHRSTDMEYAERAAHMLNSQQPNWKTRRVLRATVLRIRKIDLYTTELRLSLVTNWNRPKKFLRGNGGTKKIITTFRDVNMSHPAYLGACYPSSVHFENKDALVWIITLVKDVRRAFRSQLQAFKRMSQDDKQLRWLVYDFHSKDANIEQELRRSLSEASFRYILAPQAKFCRSHGINSAVASLTDDAIVFIMDASVSFNSTTLGQVRSLVRRGFTAFFPIVWGKDVQAWIDYGYGVNAMFKSDYWGMNATRWGCKWGAEDLDFVQRSPVHVIRTREASMQHQSHAQSPTYHRYRNVWTGQEPVVPRTTRWPGNVYFTPPKDVFRLQGTDMQQLQCLSHPRIKKKT